MLTVIFEGADRVGKSSLMQEFLKQCTYEHVCVDRMYVSQCVYAIKRIRLANMDKPLATLDLEFTEQLKMCANINRFDDDIVVVHVTANEETIIDRCALTHHPVVPMGDVDAFNACIEIIKKHCTDAKVVHIDTTSGTVQEIASALLEQINRYIKEKNNG